MQLTRLGLIILLCAVPMLAASAYVPSAASLALGWMIAVAALATLDGFTSRRLATFEVYREVEGKLSLGVENRVRIRVRSRCRRGLALQLKDSPPVAFVTPSRQVQVALGPYGETSASYRTTPVSRGDFRFGDVHVRGLGRLRLCAWLRVVPLAAEVKVYPNLLQLREYELLSRMERLQDLGVHLLHRRGEGTQFESLREYVPDDEFRRIDWKATARKRKPITRQYEIERSQNVMIMLDAGRMMTAEVAGLSKLDHAINAALLLAHVACARDDAVGLIAFGRRVDTYVPLRKGRAQVARIVDQMYALQPTLDEPDYQGAFSLLTGRARKRALVVVFTDLVDADASQRLLAHIAALVPRHLPLMVTMRDTELETMAHQMPAQIEDVYQRAIADHVLTARESALLALRSRGALVLDVPPGKLTVAAVNEYLRLKAAGTL